MFYEFPKNISLAEVREVVASHNDFCGTHAFIEADRSDHVIFNYVVAFENSFPTPNTGDPILDRKYGILRECRGLTFSKDGELLARKYHKFFNVNEKAETQIHLIDWNKPFHVLDKLDGSMITPFRSQGDIRWATKMGITDVALPVEDFVSSRTNYQAMARDMISRNLTPIFEWCTRKQKIVIDYPEDSLILTAIRENHSGRYLSYPELREISNEYYVPLVRVFEWVGDPHLFITQTKALLDSEGHVLRFDSGHMLKAKADDYCMRHGIKDSLGFEKDVLQMILTDKLDDMKPMMDDDDRNAIEWFVNDFTNNVADSARRLSERVVGLRGVHPDKKSLAISLASDPERGMIFSIYDGKDAEEVVRAIIAKNVGSGPKVDTVRHWFGDIRWDEYRVSKGTDDE